MPANTRKTTTGGRTASTSAALRKQIDAYTTEIMKIRRDAARFADSLGRAGVTRGPAPAAGVMPRAPAIGKSANDEELRRHLSEVKAAMHAGFNVQREAQLAVERALRELDALSRGVVVGTLGRWELPPPPPPVDPAARRVK